MGDVKRLGGSALLMLIMLSALPIFAPQFAFCEMYRWTNADGSIGFADDPGKVPPQYRKQAQGEREGETASGGGVYYSKPSQQVPPSAGTMAHDKPKREPERKMTEEEQKKEEEKIRASWENMKKALRGY